MKAVGLQMTKGGSMVDWENIITKTFASIGVVTVLVLIGVLEVYLVYGIKAFG